MSPEGKTLQSRSSGFVLLGLLAGDIAFNIWYLVDRHRREKAWNAALADEVEKAKSGASTISD